jgi:hypothetical protein
MHEYLLSVAEQIVDYSAPPDIAFKYYELKNTLLAKNMLNANKTH